MRDHRSGKVGASTECPEDEGIYDEVYDHMTRKLTNGEARIVGQNMLI